MRSAHSFHHPPYRPGQPRSALVSAPRRRRRQPSVQRSRDLPSHLHLGFNRPARRLLRYVEALRIDVDTLALEAVEARQRLVNLPRNMQPHMLIDAAEARNEVIPIPFKSCASGWFQVVRPVVYLDRHHLALYTRQQPIDDAVGRDSVLIEPNMVPVQINISGVPHTFELEEDPATRDICG